MNQFSQQFAIIDKIKCLVRKTGSSIFRTKKDLGISEDIAKKIQKSAYDLSHLKEKDTFTPPYMVIAEQLQVEDDQIFRAAVSNLANIAINESKFAEAILKTMEESLQHTLRTKDQVEYVKTKINTVKDDLRSK